MLLLPLPSDELVVEGPNQMEEVHSILGAFDPDELKIRDDLARRETARSGGTNRTPCTEFRER